MRTLRVILSWDCFGWLVTQGSSARIPDFDRFWKSNTRFRNQTYWRIQTNKFWESKPRKINQREKLWKSNEIFYFKISFATSTMTQNKSKQDWNQNLMQAIKRENFENQNNKRINSDRFSSDTPREHGNKDRLILPLKNKQNIVIKWVIRHIQQTFKQRFNKSCLRMLKNLSEPASAEENNCKSFQ